MLSGIFAQNFLNSLSFRDRAASQPSFANGNNFPAAGLQIPNDAFSWNDPLGLGFKGLNTPLGVQMASLGIPASFAPPVRDGFFTGPVVGPALSPAISAPVAPERAFSTPAVANPISAPQPAAIAPAVTASLPATENLGIKNEVLGAAANPGRANGGAAIGPGQTDVIGSLSRDRDARMNQVADAAFSVYGDNPVMAELAVAQAAQESGLLGRVSGLAREHNNLFGIKGMGTLGTVSMKTKEHVGQKTVSQKAGFAKNQNLSQSFAQHRSLMGKDRYSKAWDATNLRGAAKAVKDGRYATDRNYVRNLERVANHPAVKDAIANAKNNIATRDVREKAAQDALKAELAEIQADEAVKEAMEAAQRGALSAEVAEQKANEAAQAMAEAQAGSLRAEASEMAADAAAAQASADTRTAEASQPNTGSTPADNMDGSRGVGGPANGGTQNAGASAEAGSSQGGASGAASGGNNAGIAGNTPGSEGGGGNTPGNEGGGNTPGNEGGGGSTGSGATGDDGGTGGGSVGGGESGGEGKGGDSPGGGGDAGGGAG